MASDNSICIDANILLDIVIKRDRYSKVIVKLQDKDIYVSSSSIGIAYYYSRKAGLSNAEFREITKKINIIAVDFGVIDEAHKLVGENDLEDAIQIQACLREGVTIFMTADKQLVKQYSFIHALTVELVE